VIVKLCNADQLPATGSLRSFRGKDGQEICVARVSGEPGRLFAFDNHCPHQHAPLSAGHLEGCKVVCPYHAWRFDVTTGRGEHAADPDLIRYEIRQYEDEVFIQLPDQAQP
jgi:nitrite reductase/ring-hydroxylating ferredoxin subunit